MKYSILTLGLLSGLFTACSAQTTETTPPSADFQTAEVQQSDSQIAAPAISVTKAYVLPPFPGRDVAAGFFTLQNTGGADRLMSASSPDSSSVEIHNHIDDNGVMRMRRIDGVTIETDGVVRFEPGSYHLMLFGVNFKDGQSNIDVALTYEKSGVVNLTLPIRQHDEDADEGSDEDSDEEQSQGSAAHYGSGD